jgi:hypothetical protein
LRGETVTTLHVLVDFLSKVFFHDRDLAKLLLWVWIRLQLLQFLLEQRYRVVLRVSYEERQVNEIVWVGEVLEMAEKHGQMRRRITQRRA